MSRLRDRQVRVPPRCRALNELHLKYILATAALVAVGNRAAVAFVAPTCSTSTCRPSVVAAGSSHAAAHGESSSMVCRWRYLPCYHCDISKTGCSGSFSFYASSASRDRRTRRVKMAMNSGEHHEATVGRGAFGGAQTAGARGYGLPSEASIELMRLELAEVPVDRVQNFLRNWTKRRVKADDRGWRGPIRAGGPRYGLPETTSMPVSSSRSNLGVTLSFDGSPTDVLKLEALYLRGGGTCVMVTRGVDGLARLGGMGPQIAALIRHAEDEIKAKLEVDLKDFAEEYHQRVLRGLAPAAVDGGGLGGEGGRGGGGQDKEDPVTVLPDGTIDVTPREKPKASRAPAPWEDGSAPPPVYRMEDLGEEAQLPLRNPATGGAEVAEVDAPDVKTLFGEVDSGDFNKEAFKLFETMEKGYKGEEEVAGDERGEGFDNFFAKLRANDTASQTELVTLFEAGKNASTRGGPDQSSIPVQTDLTQLEVMIGGDTGLRGGIDIFAGPPRPIGGRVGETTANPSSSSEGQNGERGEASRGTYTMFDEDGDPVLELTAEEMDALDEDKLTEAMTSVDVLISELLERPRDMWDPIVAEYTDLYLNPYYIISMRARIPKADKEEREAMHAVNRMAVSAVQQLADMHKRLEMQQLEKIRDICEAALEDMESLPDKIRYMKPLLDDKFVAYMGYAIQKEREEITKSGMDPDREPTRWLQVLGVIQKGVLSTLSKAIYDDVEAISHVMRLREPEERFTLLNYTITTLPSMHVRGFKKTATNIVDYYRTQGDACHDQELRSMILEMGDNLEVLMSEERVAVLCKEVDEWTARKAEEDSMESKMRRLREYEAEDLEMRRKTASGLWNRNMHPDARMDTEEKAEMKKLTDAIRAQNILEGEGTKGLLKGGEQRDGREGYEGADLDDPADEDDGTFGNDADLRRKLRRLTGPGGALESEARGSPQLFAPGGTLATTAAAAREATNAAELEQEAAEGVEDLSEVFSRMGGLASVSDGGEGASELRDGAEGRGEEDGSTDDEWGSFDEEDLRVRVNQGGHNGGKSAEAPRPRDEGIGAAVPGLLGGKRFERTEKEETTVATVDVRRERGEGTMSAP